MSIPESCTVLVVGGGPAGSYCASALAREGIDTVLLEAEEFPRYHIGESFLPSVRHFFRVIDLDSTFDKYGFRIKKGATFKLNHSMPDVYTDFVAAGGPDGYAYNVTRAEADELIFKHAKKCGAHVFDGVKVDGLEFESSGLPESNEIPDPGRPTSATWSRKASGTSGTIRFQYLVDASGRAGMMTVKHLKNRRYNESPQLKNVATWGYWNGGGEYGVGTHREGSPYFEALPDASGWIWYIPLHTGQVSVGVVMNQNVSTSKKRAEDLDSKGLYMKEVTNSPGIQRLLAKAELVSDLKSASDWSYSAPAYASPYVRIAGDAACFIDPFFSSGVHLAIAASLSAAVTISASIKGQCSELQAATWHSKKVAEGYTRFLLVVSSALKQIKSQDQPVISDWDEKTFDRAFNHFRPIIQGAVDVTGKLSQTEVSKTVDFCFQAFVPVPLADKQDLLAKMETSGIRDPNMLGGHSGDELEKLLSPNQMHIMHTIRARQMLRSEDTLNIDSFGTDVIDGLSPNLTRGALGLEKPAFKPIHQQDVLALMSGEEPAETAQVTSDTNGTATNGTNGHTETENGANGHTETENGVNGHIETRNGINGHTEAEKSVNGHSHLQPLIGHQQESSEATRLGMQDTLRRVAEEMETPHDTMLRMFNSCLELSVVMSVLNLGIFKRLSESDCPLSLKMLATSTGADQLLLGRLMRYLASIRMVKETSKDHFSANQASRAFSDPRVEGALKYAFHVGGPTYQALPGFLEEQKYQNHTGGKFAWHKGAKTEQDFFPWAKQNPHVLKWFQQLMSVPREGDWLDVVSGINDSKSETVLVDVGGGMGHQCARLAGRFPELNDRLVLQDLPETIQIAPPIKGVKSMPHNFFTPQVVKGADYYYLRTVLHDWEDDEAAQILQNLIPAMGPGSKILIDEMVLPNTGVHWWSASLDLHMYVMLGAMERNEDQWHSLLDKAGLKITEIKTYSPVMRHSIIVAEPK